MRLPGRLFGSRYDERRRKTAGNSRDGRRLVEHLAGPDLESLAEYLPSRLYMATFRTNRPRPSTTKLHYFKTDEFFVYSPYFADFGPLDLGQLFRYCALVNEKLSSPANEGKAIVHWTTVNPKKRANSAFLIASYAVIELKATPKDAFRALLSSRVPLPPFQDANQANSIYTIRLLDCLNALNKAFFFRLVDFYDFDVETYEHYSQVDNGDLNWIVPNKLVAFARPSDDPRDPNGLPPEEYSKYFAAKGVGTVVRLNKSTYDSRRFVWNGVAHYDLYFPDGTAPNKTILVNFLQICESVPHAVAVHCKAGLGRTGCLIGAYLVKHYRMTALEAIAWLRICRPGSVIGHQQSWLESLETWLHRQGDDYRAWKFGSSDKVPVHRYGIYSVEQPPVSPSSSAVALTARQTRDALYQPSGFRSKRGGRSRSATKPHRQESEGKTTQGDILNWAKARAKSAPQPFRNTTSTRS